MTAQPESSSVLTDLPGLECAVNIIRDSQRTAVLTGAGISTASGIPDFRSQDSSIWSRFDPFEVASLEAFRHRPEKFFGWLRTLVGDMFSAQPNPAHTAIARLQAAGFVKTVITQNVDGLHQRAGSWDVLEVHGTLDTLTCASCYHKFKSDGFIEPYLETGAIPHCPGCGHILKPDIVLFGEQLPARTWLAANEACKRCDLIIVAGSSLEVLPVASLPMRALDNGAHLILVNHSNTYLDVRADAVFHADLTTVLPLLAQGVLSE